jgi:Ca2+:H+ antiporter
MNQREIVVAPAGLGKPRSWYRVSSLTATLAGLLTTALVYLLRAPLFADLHNYPLTLFVFLWIGVMLACAFSVVRHADAAACRLGEPYGTLVLTISVIIIEVSLMAAIILHGENNPTLARDAMFATLMIVLSGMVGTALLMGALRYWEQEYNLEGARSFMVVIASLAVFALMMPDLTKTEPDPSLSPF